MNKLKLLWFASKFAMYYFNWKRLSFKLSDLSSTKAFNNIEYKIADLEETLFSIRSHIDEHVEQQRSTAKPANVIINSLSSEDYELVQFCLDACDESYRMRDMPVYSNPDMGIVAYSRDREFVVAFTGTRVQHGRRKFFNDLKADIFFWQCPLTYTRGHSHTGFFREFQERNKVLTETGLIFNKYDRNRQQLVFTGHSLGSSLAMIAGYEYEAFAPRVIGFGVPSVLGDEEFVNQIFDMSDRCMLFVHENDPVDATRVIANCLLIWSKSYSDFSMIEHRMCRTALGLAAHALDNYRKALTKMES